MLHRKYLQPAVILFIAMSTTACNLDGTQDSPELKLAWQAVLNSIKTPSTAKMISWEYFKLLHYQASEWHIEFDAQNGYGAMIRGNAIVFIYKSKKTGVLTAAPGVNISEGHYDEAINKATSEIFRTEKITFLKDDLIEITDKN